MTKIYIDLPLEEEPVQGSLKAMYMFLSSPLDRCLLLGVIHEQQQSFI